MPEDFGQARGSILTGRYPQRNGLYDMIRNDMVNYGHRYTPEEYAADIDKEETKWSAIVKRSGAKAE